jgi:hypothetical protein
MSWADVVEKFETVTETVFGSQRRHAIVETVRNLDDHDADGLLALLE